MGLAELLYIILMRAHLDIIIQSAEKFLREYPYRAVRAHAQNCAEFNRSPPNV